jgi:hypothetical protein
MATDPIGEWREAGTLLRGEWQVRKQIATEPGTSEITVKIHSGHSI